MRIKHSISRQGCTLSGQILETIFEEGEERGYWKIYCTKDKEFYFMSYILPILYSDGLCVHWDRASQDNNYIKQYYPSEQEAQQVLDYINEFSVEEAPTKMENEKSMLDKLYELNIWENLYVNSDNYLCVPWGWIYSNRCGEFSYEWYTFIPKVIKNEAC